MPSYPLFPLSVVLFPGSLMPLHIFEPRYRQMLADCAEGTHRFAMVPPGEGGEPPRLGSLGTVARIRAIQPLPDGRSNIVVSGEDRITLTDVVSDTRPYLTGSVTPLDDVPDVEIAGQADGARLKVLADRYAAALGAIADQEREAELSEDPAVSSFQVAAMVEWDFSAQYRFLAVRSARERVARLLQVLPGLVEGAEQRATVHRRASSNGRGPHHS